jgi:hypothetical protein
MELVIFNTVIKIISITIEFAIDSIRKALQIRCFEHRSVTDYVNTKNIAKKIDQKYKLLDKYGYEGEEYGTGFFWGRWHMGFIRPTDAGFDIKYFGRQSITDSEEKENCAETKIGVEVEGPSSSPDSSNPSREFGSPAYEPDWNKLRNETTTSHWERIESGKNIQFNKGHFTWAFNNRDISVRLIDEINQILVNNIRNEERHNLSVLITGDPRIGKSAIGMIIALDQKWPMVNSHNPTQPGDNMSMLLLSCAPSKTNKVVFIFNEWDIVVKKAINGIKPIPGRVTDIIDKPSYATYADKLFYKPGTICIYTSNEKAEFWNSPGLEPYAQRFDKIIDGDQYLGA